MIFVRQKLECWRYPTAQTPNLYLSRYQAEFLRFELQPMCWYSSPWIDYLHRLHHMQKPTLPLTNQQNRPKPT